MGDSGPSYKAKKLGSTSQAFGPLKCLEVQRVAKEKITTMLKVGDIWIPVDTNIKNCCTQFYKIELNTRITKGNRILKISSSKKGYHMLCWLYYINFYGRLFWRYASINDMEFNIRISSDRLQYVKYGEREDEVEIGKLEYLFGLFMESLQ